MSPDGYALGLGIRFSVIIFVCWIYVEFLLSFEAPCSSIPVDASKKENFRPSLLRRLVSHDVPVIFESSRMRDSSPPGVPPSHSL